ncbi:MAG TPA: hypothetical protein VGF17_09890 [Phytomonospora sp.]
MNARLRRLTTVLAISMIVLIGGTATAANAADGTATATVLTSASHDTGVHTLAKTDDIVIQGYWDYVTSNAPVRPGPRANSGLIATLQSGSDIYIDHWVINEHDNYWAYITWPVSGYVYDGHVNT